MANHMRDPHKKENKTDRMPAMAEAEMNNVIHFNPTLLKTLATGVALFNV
jgi:hypothetical protein